MSEKVKNGQRAVARILAIGNELLNGAISDTNTATIARFLEQRGIALERSALVRDVEGEILDELALSAKGADLLITTGGLGPTSDDLTRSVISTFAGSPLKEDLTARAKLEGLFAARKRPMNETNLRQVFFPEGAEVLENSEGTADAFITTVTLPSGERTPILSLPGIPRELKHLLQEKVGPWLDKALPQAAPVTRRYLRCFGRSESYLGKKIEELSLPSHIEIAYRPMFPEILLTFSDATSRSGDALSECLRAVRDHIGAEFVFSEQPSENMAQCVSRLLRERGETFAVAESCTGGMIADSVVSLPGSSQVFLGGVVSYSNQVKVDLLGVDSHTLRAHGAVSAEVAKQMAAGAREKLKSHFAIAVTGIAGPDGGSVEKPVGTAWIGIADTTGSEAVPQFYAIKRNMFRTFCSAAALDLLRRKLLNLPLEWQRL